jgi:RNA exonuclease 1
MNKETKSHRPYDPLSPPSPSPLKHQSTQPTKTGESPLTRLAPSISPSTAAQEKPPANAGQPIPTPPKFTDSSRPVSLLAKPASLASGEPANRDGQAKPPLLGPQTMTKPARKPEVLNPRHLQKAPAPHNIRLQLLKLLHQQFVRLNDEVSKLSEKHSEIKDLVLSSQELIWMALDREQHIAVTKASIYPNIIKQDVVRHKRMSVDDWVKQRREATEKKPPEKTPANGPPVIINTGLSAEHEVDVLKRRLVTPIAGLAAYGYVPIPPTDDQIAEAKAAVEMSQNWEKCDRCTARFQVFPGRNIETGELASGGSCTHHPGRQYLPDRPKGDFTHIPKRYRCCQQDVGETPGCAKASNHVWKTSDPKRLATLWNYAATPPNVNPDTAKAVCFDCEMGYTVYGMELVRLTATSWPDGAELLDVLVQPFGEILDLNSQYSGVFPEDLARAVSWSKDWKPPAQKPGERKILQKVSSPEVARELFFSLISPETVLIGHGLENDLNAMRMVHPKLVDTILVYPHKRGLPIRNGLKALMEQYLNRRIQMQGAEGHDSAEDARAAGELARLRVQKEWSSMQSHGWKIVDGVLREPNWKDSQREGRISEDSEEGGARLSEEFLEAP